MSRWTCKIGDYDDAGPAVRRWFATMAEVRNARHQAHLPSGDGGHTLIPHSFEGNSYEARNRRGSGRSCCKRIRADCAVGCRRDETCRCQVYPRKARDQRTLCGPVFRIRLPRAQRLPVDCGSQARGRHLRNRVLLGWPALSLRRPRQTKEPGKSATPSCSSGPRGLKVTRRTSKACLRLRLISRVARRVPKSIRFHS